MVGLYLTYSGKMQWCVPMVVINYMEHNDDKNMSVLRVAMVELY